MNTFTEAELAVIIDLWYLDWKERIVENHQVHKLGFAKEELKRELAGHKK